MRKLVLALFGMLLLVGCKKSYQEKFNIKEIDNESETDVCVWEVKTQNGRDTVYASYFYSGQNSKTFYFYAGNNKNDIIAAYPIERVLSIKRVASWVDKKR